MSLKGVRFQIVKVVNYIWFQMCMPRSNGINSAPLQRGVDPAAQLDAMMREGGPEIDLSGGLAPDGAAADLGDKKTEDVEKADSDSDEEKEEVKQEKDKKVDSDKDESSDDEGKKSASDDEPKKDDKESSDDEKAEVKEKAKDKPADDNSDSDSSSEDSSSSSDGFS